MVMLDSNTINGIILNIIFLFHQKARVSFQMKCTFVCLKDGLHIYTRGIHDIMEFSMPFSILFYNRSY